MPPAPTLQQVALDPTLWGLVAPPMAGALAAFAVGLREERARAGDLRRSLVRRRVALVAAGFAALSFALVLARVARLAEMPATARVLADHVLRLARVGAFDANLDLAFDPIAAVASGAIAFAGALALALGARADADRSAHATGALSLAVAALLLASLAAEGVVAFAALDLAALALLVANDPRSRLFRRVLAGGLGSLSGLAIVFWGLGGGWTGGDYTVDFSPRVVAVRAPSGDASAIEGGDAALLTMLTHPGAVVFLDDARTPLLDGDRALRSPFVRHAISPGRHTLRVHSGSGADDFVVPDAIAAAGEEMTIAWVGPTTSFRELREALEIHDDLGRAPVREAVVGRELVSGLRIADAASVLVVVGVGATLLAMAAAARRSGAALLGDAALVAVVWYVAARVDPLLALAPLARTAFVVLGVGAWLAAAWRLRRGGPVSHALAALVVVAAGARAAPSGAIVVAAGIVALASAAFSPDGRSTGAASSALAGAPIPLLGVAWGAFGILDSAWTFPANGRVLAAIVVAAMLVGAFLVGAASRRVEKPRVSPTSIALGVAAAILGPLLGASRSWLGERGSAMATNLLDPFVTGWASGGRSHEVVVAFAWTGAALGGWAYARRRPAPELAPGPTTDGSEDLSGLPRAALDLVLGFDRWVVQATVGGLANVAKAFAWSVARGGAALLDAPSDAAARAIRDAALRSVVTAGAMTLAAVGMLALAAWAAR